ncbi:hypothetical protein RJ640_022021 [Escallonia rubra]|uniref:RRM domain-containing protein n=1 Tax=Escallonia rubra TaxID=112253 RepID=A0AA88QLG8_9ASTE|nr:hypothetical protein RJ640_022021 [Escallonia rubra]
MVFVVGSLVLMGGTMILVDGHVGKDGGAFQRVLWCGVVLFWRRGISDPNKISAYRDRRFQGTQEEFEHALLTSTTVYVGNMSFYTTEEQVYELFSRGGEIKKIVMGLDKNTKTPCGFCFLMYYSREDAEDSVKYLSGTILDDRPIRVDFDWGFQEGRQWGRGRSGGQVRDEYRTDYDPDILSNLCILILFFLEFARFPCWHLCRFSLDVVCNAYNVLQQFVLRRGGYGKLVQKELEAQRHLVDYGTGSLGSFPPVMQPQYARHGGNHGHGGSHRHGRDYNRKRHREDDRHAPEMSKRTSDHESHRNSDHDSRPEKNPRFRESGDSDDDEEDGQKRRP